MDDLRIPVQRRRPQVAGPGQPRQMLRVGAEGKFADLIGGNPTPEHPFALGLLVGSVALPGCTLDRRIPEMRALLRKACSMGAMAASIFSRSSGVKRSSREKS